eukprot:38880-Eustigmatos_ZCMA.PRE.1
MPFCRGYSQQQSFKHNAVTSTDHIARQCTHCIKGHLALQLLHERGEKDPLDILWKSSERISFQDFVPDSDLNASEAHQPVDA